VLAEKDKNRKR